MDWLEVAAGVLFVIYPALYNRQMAVIRRKLAARDGDVEKFNIAMDRRFIRVSLWVAPVTGGALVALGLSS